MNIKELTLEVRRLRSAVIGLIAEDQEGEYDPAYVKRVLSMRSDRADKEFTDATSFIKDVRAS